LISACVLGKGVANVEDNDRLPWPWPALHAHTARVVWAGDSSTFAQQNKKAANEWRSIGTALQGQGYFNVKDITRRGAKLAEITEHIMGHLKDWGPRDLAEVWTVEAPPVRVTTWSTNMKHVGNTLETNPGDAPEWLEQMGYTAKGWELLKEADSGKADAWEINWGVSDHRMNTSAQQILGDLPARQGIRPMCVEKDLLIVNYSLNDFATWDHDLGKWRCKDPHSDPKRLPGGFTERFERSAPPWHTSLVSLSFSTGEQT
jgi:hypothetical protein